MRKCLIDAGPLIALFDKNDDYHKPMLKFLQKYEGRLLTSWAIITEALHMLDFNVHVQIDFLKWIERDAIEIPVLSKQHVLKIIELSEKYSDISMDFAAATLIVISEIEKIKEIITIDSDFEVYRKMRKEMLNNIFTGDAAHEY